MSATAIQIIKAARKCHQCSYCGTRIEVGETYKRYRWHEDGAVATVKIHPECHDAFNRLSLDDQQKGFCTGDNPRGCNCGHTEGCENCASIRAKKAA